MDPQTAQLISTALNGAFSLLAAWRRKGMTDAEISARLDRVDAGEDPVTVAEVIASEEAWQSAIDEGRQMSESNALNDNDQ